jgi:hypothetical protein
MNPTLVWLKTCALNFKIFHFYSISPLGRNRIKHHSSTLIPHHRWTEMKLTYENSIILLLSSKLNSSIGSNLIRRSSSLLQRKHENTLHFARSGASLILILSLKLVTLMQNLSEI